MTKTIFDFMDVVGLPDALAVIPYYGGQSDATHASRLTNPVYFLKTYHSMTRYFDRVAVFVCTERDYDLVSRLPGKIVPTIVECNPIHLPVSCLRHLQKQEQDFRYLFYTEADQILYTNCLPEMAVECDQTRYVVPHRFTRLYPHLTWPTEKFEIPCPITEFDGKVYEVRHYTPRDNPSGERFYQVRNRWRGFGGCWLAGRRMFLETDFRDVDYQPVEEACFAMFTAEREMLRTFDPYEFFVDHLSGFEQVLRDRNLDVMNLTGAW